MVWIYSLPPCIEVCKRFWREMETVVGSRRGRMLWVDLSQRRDERRREMNVIRSEAFVRVDWLYGQYIPGLAFSLNIPFVLASRPSSRLQEIVE